MFSRVLYAGRVSLSVATVMTFMFLGDGLRDAADPYK